ncbi:hypothetical protein Hanom_Chr04g00332921 [Helianthus anomalus]
MRLRVNLLFHGWFGSGVGPKQWSRSAYILILILHFVTCFLISHFNVLLTTNK